MMKLSIDIQNKLLQQSIAENMDFADVLEHRHLKYDDLRYVDGIDNDTLTNSFEPIKTLDDIAVSKPTIPAVSFFTGAGGLDIGFKYAGFRNIIGIEHTELFCNTLRHNNPDQIIIGPPTYSGDISDREKIAKILEENGVHENFEGVFHGGPPCQSFSIAANQRFNKDGENFKRKGFDDEEKGMLFFDYVWYIKKFKPLAFLIENVSGIVECDPDGRIDKTLDDLRKLGYTIKPPQVLDATFYGVPQHRKRWIAMGIRGEIAVEYPTQQSLPTPCGYVFTKSLDNVPNHITRKHNAESVVRYSQLKPGGRDKQGRVDRLDPFQPSKTVIAGGVKGGGRSHLHPYFPRTLSVRECARLQTFPDSYVFTGTYARQFTQVGNAVPPLLAYKLACQIKLAIEANQYSISLMDSRIAI